MGILARMTNETSAQPDAPPASPRRSFGRPFVAALGIGVALAVTLSWHVSAGTAFERSISTSRPLADRVAAAAQAHSMEPWNAAFELRFRLLSAWLLGKQQLERGDYNAAVETLDAAYRLDIGNPELLALYHTAQEAQALATNRKAHLQHGHEGPGGTLRPQDIER